MQPVLRYHPFLVTLHWLLAFLIVAALALGFLALAPTSNAAPEKVDALQAHMIGGMLILALMIMRFVVRLLTWHPLRATTGFPRLDRLAPITHYGFYLLILLMVGTGFATAILAGLPDIVFARSGKPLPPDFLVYPTRVVHGYLAWLLVALIVLHVLAALYHQLVRKDGLLRRMAFGRRVASPVE
ncbi:MAG: cytochrome b/b6 domain-containing protein [Hyphomicrobiales bacterium]|nr:cytochrome b/b6 domain-containing protein [Hyphomicrobiales bacterium]